MTREKLLKSNEYWIGEIQHKLFKLITEHLEKEKISRAQFAKQLGVTKGYVSQILNGEFDHKISKFVQLALSIGKVPRVEFFDIEQILKLDEYGELYKKKYESINIELKFDENSGIIKPNIESPDTIIDERDTSKYYFAKKENEKEDIIKEEYERTEYYAA